MADVTIEVPLPPTELARAVLVVAEMEHHAGIHDEEGGGWDRVIPEHLDVVRLLAAVEDGHLAVTARIDLGSDAVVLCFSPPDRSG